MGRRGPPSGTWRRGGRGRSNPGWKSSVVCQLQLKRNTWGGRDTRRISGREPTAESHSPFRGLFRWTQANGRNQPLLRVAHATGVGSNPPPPSSLVPGEGPWLTPRRAKFGILRRSETGARPPPTRFIRTTVGMRWGPGRGGAETIHIIRGGTAMCHGTVGHIAGILRGEGNAAAGNEVERETGGERVSAGIAR